MVLFKRMKAYYTVSKTNYPVYYFLRVNSAYSNYKEYIVRTPKLKVSASHRALKQNCRTYDNKYTAHVTFGDGAAKHYDGWFAMLMYNLCAKKRKAR